MLFILRTIIQWRKFILASGILTAIGAGVVSFLLPKWYTATASVFPPDLGGTMTGYAQLLQQSLQVPIVAPSAVGARPNTVYIDVMLSQRLGEKLVNEFGLKNRYKTGLMVTAIDVLHSHSSFTLLENGLLKVSFEDKDAGVAAAITNRYVDLLDEFNREINVSRASKTREFVGGQLEIHERELRAAEESLRDFQERHEALQLDQQVTSAIDIVASLTAEAVAMEVDLDMLRQYASPSSEEYIRKKREYDEILKQLNKFKADSARGNQDDVRSFFPSFDKLPEMALEMARRLRRVKTEEAIYALLTQEYEKARIEEARDTPTVQVLDTAKVPELRSRPRRKMLVIFGGVVGLGWSTLLAVFISVWREDRERARSALSVFSPVASDLKRLLSFKKRS
jgi:LPS O-antigen subunit length determinant protein (WzzB/FepE family)